MIVITHVNTQPRQVFFKYILAQLFLWSSPHIHFILCTKKLIIFFTAFSTRIFSKKNKQNQIPPKKKKKLHTDPSA